jgi:hypothetical protein
MASLQSTAHLIILTPRGIYRRRLFLPKFPDESDLDSPVDGILTVRGQSSGINLGLRETMTTDENAGYWEFALDSRLRQSSGDSFQRLFEDFMTRVHGEDFVPVRPHGNVGDGGLDGYFCLNDTVYQCYGAQNGHVAQISRIQRKMHADFQRACDTSPAMKHWKFAHNLVDGVPRPLLDTLQEIKAIATAKGITAMFFGLASFRDLLSSLDDGAKTRLLGVRAFNDLEMERLPDEIRKIVASLIEEIRPIKSRRLPVKTVPKKKLVINKIDDHWKSQIEFFLRYSVISRRVVQTQGNTTYGPKLGTFFRDKYEALRDEGMEPSRIFFEVKTMLTGRIHDLDGELRDFAAMVLIADLFESCVLFEETGDEAERNLAYDPA